MGKTRCPSRSHVVKFVEQEEGKPSITRWRCDHCKQCIFNGKQFKANIARVHLAADSTNGLCAKLCTATDEHAAARQKQFRSLIESLKEKQKTKSRKRKQQIQRIAAQVALQTDDVLKRKKKKTQSKLSNIVKARNGAAADLAVSQWAIAHDIPMNALRGPYWKAMNSALNKVCSTYVPLYPQKLKKEMLPQLKSIAVMDQQKHLQHNPAAGRTLTGDGATKGVPLINFLVHVPGKGVTLLDVQDCTDHMAEGGTKDAL